MERKEVCSPGSDRVVRWSRSEQAIGGLESRPGQGMQCRGSGRVLSVSASSEGMRGQPGQP